MKKVITFLLFSVAILSFTSLVDTDKYYISTFSDFPDIEVTTK